MKSGLKRQQKPWYGVLGELLWGTSLALYEACVLGRQRWWRRLHWLLFRRYRRWDPDARVVELRGQNPGSLAYGETPCLSVCRLLELSGVRPPARVVDLGCGRGLPLFTAASLGYQATGIEFMGEYLKPARDIAQELELAVEFYQGDFLKADIPPGDLYLIASTAFPEGVRQQLAQRLAEQAPPGAQVVTGDWFIEHPAYERGKTLPLPVTWGTSLFTFHTLTGSSSAEVAQEDDISPAEDL